LTAAAVETVASKERGVKGVVDFVQLALCGILLGVMLGDEDQLTEIAEGGGATRGNLVGGKSFEDALEGSAHIEMGVRAKKFADIAFEVFFDLGAAESLHAAVGLAVAVHDGGHAALASISKEEVAEVKRRGLRAASHFLQYKLTFNILSSNYMGASILVGIEFVRACHCNANGSEGVQNSNALAVLAEDLRQSLVAVR
jgi:hypothetical protein